MAEEEKFSFSDFFQKGKEYLDTQKKLWRLKALAKGSRIGGSIVLDAVKILFTLFILFFCSLALGFYLGEVLGSYSLGFLATGAIFFVVLLLIRVFEPKLEAIFMNITIRKIAGKWQGEEDEEEDENDEIKSNVNEEFNTNK